MMNAGIKTLLVCLFTLVLVCMGVWVAHNKMQADRDVIILHGASLFNDEHSYTKALIRFTELVETYYNGPADVQFVLHKNRELGTEKDYFGYMNIGAVVDFAIVAPSHASTFSRMVTLMDVPFLFRDTEHYLQVIEQDVFAPIAKSIEERADVVLLGYGGGEKRHLFGNKPLKTMDDLKGFRMRVMGAPIQSRMYSQLGAQTRVISSDEVYNALQTGAIIGAENSASALEQFKWHEVADYVSLTSVSIIVRPLYFSGKRMRSLPPDLQEAIRKAGREAMKYERMLEIETDDPLMTKLEAEDKISTLLFEERDKMLEIAAPVKAAFAKEIGAEDVLKAVNDIP